MCAFLYDLVDFWFSVYLVFIEKNMNNCLLVEVYLYPGDKYSSLEAVNNTLAQSVAAASSLGTFLIKI